MLTAGRVWGQGETPPLDRGVFLRWSEKGQSLLKLGHQGPFVVHRDAIHDRGAGRRRAGSLRNVPLHNGRKVRGGDVLLRGRHLGRHSPRLFSIGLHELLILRPPHLDRLKRNRNFEMKVMMSKRKATANRKAVFLF
jgi:hypothetical protein